MAIKAVLKIDGKKFNLLDATYNFSRYHSLSGYVGNMVRFEHIQIIIPYNGDIFFLHWMFTSALQKSGSISFYEDEDMIRKVKHISFAGAFCIDFKEIYHSNSAMPLYTMLTIAAGGIKIEESIFRFPWFKGPFKTEVEEVLSTVVEYVTPEVEKPKTEATKKLAKQPTPQPTTHPTHQPTAQPVLMAGKGPIGISPSPISVPPTSPPNATNLALLTPVPKPRENPALVKAVLDKAIEIIKTTNSKKGTGPCLSGIYDTVTGETFFGQNFKSNATGKKAYEDWRDADPSDGGADPIIKEIIKEYDEKIDKGEIKPSEVRDERSGAHSEIRALDQLIKDRRAKNIPVDKSSFKEFDLHNRDLWKTDKSGDPAPKDRFENCAYISNGINSIGHT